MCAVSILWPRWQTGLKTLGVAGALCPDRRPGVISDGRSGARQRVIRHHERVAGDADPNVQRFRRAFHWGALVIMDAASTDVPTQPAASGVATTDAGLMVPVRHA